jgi:hypothetical protein
LLSNILHLVPDPIEILSSFSGLLTKESQVVALVPNLLGLPVLWHQFRGLRPNAQGGSSATVSNPLRLADLASYEKTGVHFTSHAVVRKWFRQAGLTTERLVDILPPPAQRASRATLGLLDSLLASELLAVARKNCPRSYEAGG